MSKQKNNSNNIESQLSAIDPLPQNFEAPHDSLLHRAAKAASATPVRARKFISPLKLTSALGATAMVIVAGVFFSTTMAPSLAPKTQNLSQGNLQNDSVITQVTVPDAAKAAVSKLVAGNPAIDGGANPTKPGQLVITIGGSGASNLSNPGIENPKVAAGAGPMSDASGSGVAGSAATSNVAGSSMIKCMYFWGGGCGWFKTEYKAADTLSNKPGTGTVYRIDAKSKPAEVAQSLSGALGLNLPVESWTDEWSKQPNYFVGANPTAENAWQKASILVYGDPANNYWYYYDNAAYAWPECVPVVATNPDGTTTDAGYCESQPVKDSKAPGQVRAMDYARNMLHALGYNVVNNPKGAKDNSVYLTYQADDWGSSVNAYLVVDQQLTTVSWYLYWNAITGQLVSAGGTNAVATAAGEFTTQSAAEAFKRVGTWQWQGGFYADNSFNWGNDRPYPNYTPVCPVPLDLMLKTETGTVEPAVDPVPVDVVIDPVPVDGTVDPVVDPQPCVENPPAQVITVGSSQKSLLQLWDDQQVQWLVPGYLFFDDYGYVANAISLPEGVIKLPENSFITY